MNRYQITIKDDAGEVIEQLDQAASCLRLALEVSAARLRLLAAGHGEAAVSATVEKIADVATPWRCDECGEVIPGPDGEGCCPSCGGVEIELLPQRDEAADEALLDRRVQARLATDRAYLNAESSEAQAEREREIEDEEVARLARERGVEVV